MIAGSWLGICSLPIATATIWARRINPLFVASNGERQYLTWQRHKCHRTFARLIAKISLLARTTLAEVEGRR